MPLVALLESRWLLKLWSLFEELMQATSDTLQQESLKALSRVLPPFDQADWVNMQDRENLSADLILLQTAEIRFYRATKSRDYQTVSQLALLQKEATWNFFFCN